MIRCTTVHQALQGMVHRSTILFSTCVNISTFPGVLTIKRRAANYCRGVYRGGFGSSLLPSGLRGGTKSPPEDL